MALWGKKKGVWFFAFPIYGNKITSSGMFSFHRIPPGCWDMLTLCLVCHKWIKTSFPVQCILLTTTCQTRKGVAGALFPGEQRCFRIRETWFWIRWFGKNLLQPQHSSLLFNLSSADADGKQIISNSECHLKMSKISKRLNLCDIKIKELESLLVSKIQKHNCFFVGTT